MPDSRSSTMHGSHTLSSAPLSGSSGLTRWPQWKHGTVRLIGRHPRARERPQSRRGAPQERAGPHGGGSSRGSAGGDVAPRGWRATALGVTLLFVGLASQIALSHGLPAAAAAKVRLSALRFELDVGRDRGFVFVVRFDSGFGGWVVDRHGLCASKQPGPRGPTRGHSHSFMLGIRTPRGAGLSHLDPRGPRP